MPSKGYRKGVSDRKVPQARQVYFRISARAYRALVAETDARSLTLSELMRRIAEAHLARQRVELPHRQANAALLRELARIGNNVNQIAHQANLMSLHLVQARADACLASLDDLLRRLAR